MAHKPKEFQVESLEEFQEWIDNKDFRIAEAVVSGILANLKGKKKHVHLLSILVIEENSIFDITCERKHFAETLEENLPHYVREERYEECQMIADVIAELKGNEISSLLTNLTSSKK